MRSYCSRRHQRGMGLGYLMLFVFLAALAGSFVLKNSDSMSSVALDSQWMAGANDLDRAATDLAVRMSQLRMTYGGGVAVRITGGQYVSPAIPATFPAMTLPALPASASTSGWSMSENDRLQVPVTGDLIPVATAEVVSAVCTKFNSTHIVADAPTLVATPGNAYGGTTYSVSNGGFNAGRPSTLFCAPGAGSGGRGLLILGFLTT